MAPCIKGHDRLEKPMTFAMAPTKNLVASSSEAGDVIGICAENVEEDYLIF